LGFERKLARSMYSPKSPVSSGWRFAAIATGAAIAKVDIEMKQRRDKEQHVHDWLTGVCMMRSSPWDDFR